MLVLRQLKTIGSTLMSWMLVASFSMAPAAQAADATSAKNQPPKRVSSVKRSSGEFLSAYKKSKTMAELATNLKPLLSDEDYKFYLRLADDFKGEALPRLERRSDEEFVFSYKSKVVRVQLRPGESVNYLVNGKVLDFASALTAEDRFNKIMGVFPKSSSSSARFLIFDLFEPRAHAWLAMVERAVGFMGGVVGLLLGLNAGNEYCDKIAEKELVCQNVVRELYTAKRIWDEDRAEADEKIKAGDKTAKPFKVYRQSNFNDLSNKMQTAIGNIEHVLKDATGPGAWLTKTGASCRVELQALATNCVDKIRNFARENSIDLQRLSADGPATPAASSGGAAPK